jgi:hypothetical protein
MWTLLVGLIERWWREKPRLDVVRSVVRLRDSMARCQDLYIKHVSSSETEADASNYSKTRDDWIVALGEIAERLQELDTVISIFNPAARSAISDYMSHEYSLMDKGAGRLNLIASDLGGNLGLDLDHLELSTDFEKATLQLDAFISQNFKPDEIFAVSTSRWR